MISVLQPDLPSASDLAPYLTLIDRAGQYTNDGRMVRGLEEVLGGVCVANATLGLELAAKYVFKSGKVRVPAFTFPATLTAVIRAGLEPVLCDIDPITWEAADVDDITLNVCPFGFISKRGGPLLDAAAVAPMVPRIEHIACVVSLHATKPLPAGEGAVVYGDEGLLDYIRHARNFGLRNGHIEFEGGTNAKMSEYHAVVGLASLKRYPAVAAKRMQIAARYAENLAGSRVETKPYQGGTVYPVLVDSPVVVAGRLSRFGIETRRWYCPTLDMHPAFASVKRESLKVAHDVASRLLCLPFHTFMSDRDVDRVCEVLCGS